MRTLLTLAGVAGIALCAGCAQAPFTKADVDGRIVCDSSRMAKVEQQARLDNKEVRWVNCPTVTLRTS